MDMDYEGAAEIERAWREGLTPDPLLTVSEWSDRHRMLSSKASAEPGRWRTSRTPYLKAIMDCLSPMSAVERIVFMKAAQLGATEMGSNWIGYVIHHAPGPMMAVWPTVEMAKRNSKQRIDPLIEESAALAELIAPARSRDSGNTILAKEFRGGVFVMTGANSAVGLRSMPVHYLFLDEVDGYPLDKDRIEASVWAFGRGKESWLVEHRVLMGDTARDTVWKRLAEMLAETWTHASGAAMPLVRFALDTGFATQEAYAFVRACRDSRVMAVKGVPRGAALIGTPTAIDVSQGGKKLRRGIKVYSVAVSIAKLEFYNNLRKSADVGEDGLTTVFPAGFVHLPKIDAEFIQQLCAEQLITRRDRNGYPVREWQKMRERNEALDCYVYARVAASSAGLDRFEERHWRELERQLGLASPPDPETPTESINETTTRDKFGGGLAVSGNRNTSRRVIKSRWLS